MGVIKPYFSSQAIRASIIQAKEDLDLKGKVVSLDGYFLKTYSDLTLIGHGGHSTLF